LITGQPPKIYGNISNSRDSVTEEFPTIYQRMTRMASNMFTLKGGSNKLKKKNKTRHSKKYVRSKTKTSKH
jgi:hypothetical protein